MRRNMYLKIASFVVIITALVFTGVANETSAPDVPKRPARVRKRMKKRTVNYVCPMHPDMRSKSRGECPKCGMDLVKARNSS